MSTSQYGGTNTPAPWQRNAGAYGGSNWSGAVQQPMQLTDPNDPYFTGAGGGPVRPFNGPTAGTPPGMAQKYTAPSTNYQGIWNPLDPGIAKAGPSILPESNWQPPSGLLSPDVITQARAGDNRMYGAFSDPRQASQTASYYGVGGAGYDPQLSSDAWRTLGGPSVGVDTLMGQTRDLYQQNGIIGANGQWLKKQDNAGNWVPI